MIDKDRMRTKYDYEKEVAEAVVASFAEVSLHRMRDAPDVDLHHCDGYHVGMEIVRLIDERELSLAKRLCAARDLIRDALLARSVQGCFCVIFDIQEMYGQSDKRSWDRVVPSNLAAVIKARGAVQLDRSQLVAAGITGIALVEADAAAKTSVSHGWRVTTKPGHTLAEIQLASKHQKLARYRVENGERFAQYWLAIASFGLGVGEDGGYSQLLARDFATDYDRVLLVNHGANGRMVGAQDVTPK